MKTRLSVPLLFCLLTSCAYYNGLYNAKRYSKQAERDERAGRTSAAADGWRLAAQHAESVYVRHRQSRWADDARLIRGRALVHLEAWNDAELTLNEAIRSAQGVEQRREAWLYLGRAELGARRYPIALNALDSAVLTQDRQHRNDALLYRGRVWMALGRADLALADFRASENRDARFERPRAALAAGSPELAAAFADSLLELPYREEAWLPLLDSLSHAGMAGHAGELVERLDQRRDLPPGARARLLLGDGNRWFARGSDSLAADRYHGVIQAAPDSVEARLASVRLARLVLRYTTDSAEVRQQLELLETITSIGGVPAQESGELVRLMRQAESLKQSPAAPDAWWLARAELLRDSLGATPLAAEAFAEMATRFPDSPWTPKGLLNAVAAGHPDAEALLELLRTRYADSPYTRIANGHDGDPARYAVLEDSLRIALAVESPDERPVNGDISPDELPRNRRNNNPGNPNTPANPNNPQQRPPQRPTTRPTTVDP